MNEVRVDKWVWATRILKTRTITTEACKRGRIMIGGVTIKPSRMIKVGDVIQTRKPPIIFSSKVTGLIESRVGAKFAPNYLKSVTTSDQYEILKIDRISDFMNRAKGLERPTKKNRRELEQFTEPRFTDDRFDLEFDFGEGDEEQMC